MVSTARLFYMAVWRNWLSLKSYKLNYVFEILTSMFLGLGMLLLSLAFDASLLERTLGTKDYGSFMIIGIAFQAWQGIALWGAAGMLRDELGSGQIDYTFSCPFSRYLYIVCSIAASAARQTLFFAPTLGVALWFTRATVTGGGLLLGLLATMLSVAALAQMGACFAALVLRHQQISAVFGLIAFGFQMLTGMFIPIQVLPQALQVVGIVFLPQSFGMDLLRHYVMGTRTVLAVPYEWAVLAAQIVVYAIVARFTVGRLERIAKAQGLHYV
jgi:ABC-2 type transport system permease protein